MAGRDSDTRLKYRGAFTEIGRALPALLNANSGNPTTVFTHDIAVAEELKADFLIHNSSASPVSVTLRVLPAGTTSPGAVVNQVFGAEVEAKGTTLLAFGKVLAYGDVVVGWAGTADVVAVHTDYAYDG